MALTLTAGTITVGEDDYDRDVNPIKTGHGESLHKQHEASPGHSHRFVVWPRTVQHSTARARVHTDTD